MADPNLPILGFRFFATERDEPRAWRVTDAITFGGSLLGLAAITAAADPLPGFIAALDTLMASIPDFLDGLWQAMADLLLLAAAVIIIVALVRRRFSVARDAVLGMAVATLMTMVAARIGTGEWPALWDPLRDADNAAAYPQVRLAVVAAAIHTARPHLSRPARRIGRWIVLLAAVALLALGSTSTLGVIAALLVASTAASLVHLVFGSCAGRPSIPDVRAALASLGVEVDAIGVAQRQEAGFFLVDATELDGAQLTVKVYGRDAHDSALVSTLWRTVWLREGGAPIRLGRQQQVEHEALLTLLAAQAGVPTETIVLAGETVSDDSLLVTRRRGTRIADGQLHTDRVVAEQLWDIVDRLTAAGIVHGRLDADHLTLDDGRLGLVDFRSGTTSPSPAERGTQDAQAMVATVSMLGVDDAVALAIERVGTERATAIVPYLQPAALTIDQRRRMKDAEIDLDDVRKALSAACGIEAPKLIQLRRITAGTILKVILPALAVLALISGLSDMDLEQVVDEIRNAIWWLVLLGFLLGQVPRFPQALSTLGASPKPIPLGPLYALQLAVSYINLAIPSSAARVAVNIRFFQRHGVPPGGAIAAGAVDGFAGLVMQAMILVTLLLFSPATLDLDLSSATDGIGTILTVLVITVVVALLAVAVVGKLRRFVVHWARELLGEARQVAVIVRQPRRLLLVFGGNLLAELIFAVTLGTFAASLGYHVGFADLLLINITVSLFAGLLPIPGGIGVVEGGLTIGLVRAGVPEEAAFAIAIMHRIATFYVPPTWGFFAFRWLERNEHL
jgi:glycosyltransferase 2 family protein